MSSNDIDELVLKVNVDVNEDELKKLREDMKKFQEDAAKTKVNLIDQAQIDKLKEEIEKLKANAKSILGEGMPFTDEYNRPISKVKGPGYVPKEAPYRPSSNGAGLTVPLSSDQSLEVLKKIEQEQNEMLMLQKKQEQRKERITDEEERRSKEGGGTSVGEALSTAHGIADQSLASSAGGAIGGLIGLLGGPVASIAGAKIGSSIIELFEKIAGDIKEEVQQVSEMFDKQLTENIQFRQIHQTTGMAIKDIYELGVRARLAGTSLQDVVDSNQRLTDELIGGMSDTKAQLLMALNINPRQAMSEAGNDPAKLNQLIFQRALEATRGYAAPYRTSILKNLGFNEKEQDWRRYINRSDYESKAEEAYNTATQEGKNPIRMGEELHQDILQFRGQAEIIAGLNRSLLTKDNLAKKLSVGLMQIEGTVKSIIIKSVDKIEGLGQPPPPPTPLSRVETHPHYNNQSRERGFFYNPFIHNTPASDSGSSKAAGTGG